MRKSVEKREKMDEWGGIWTVKKKEVLKRYLDTYQIALKNKPFEKWYIDAFAGVGTHSSGEESDSNPFFSLDFGDEDVEQELTFRRQGSPLLALQTIPPFDRYIFIEKAVKRCAVLSSIIDEHRCGKSIDVVNKDANEYLATICDEITLRRREIRAVLFLDPYGMQVSWDSLKTVAATGVFDVWYLFPTMSVKRMLPKSARIDPSWVRRLDVVLGTSDWKSSLFVPDESRIGQIRLFAEQPDFEKVRPVCESDIEKYAVERLKSIFPFVVDEPLPLYNTRGKHIFSFVFAMSNRDKAAIRLGEKIAKHIIKINREVT